MRVQALTLEAYDTFALFESIYAKTATRSGYQEAVSEGAIAYANNPSKWDEIRRIKNYQTAFSAEVPDVSPYESWVSVAAAHAMQVEVGYISWYGNYVEPRPFVETASAIAYPIVAREFLAAFRRAR